MALDCYSVLGIAKGATEAEIKSAYRRQAVKVHPDKDPSPEAAHKFTEIAKAYEVLKDATSRAEYDKLGYESYWTKDEQAGATAQGTASGAAAGAGAASSPGGAGFDTMEALRNFMRTFTGEDVFAGQDKNRKGKDISITFPLTLDDVIHGPEKTIRITRKAICPTCRGQGATQGDQIGCPTCAAQGRVRDSNNQIVDCPTCEGSKTHFTHPCEMCNGKGINRIKDRVRFRVPPGAGEGNLVTISGKGHTAFRNADQGDLIITFTEKIDRDLERRGSNVIREVPVDLYTMLLGGKVSFKDLRHNRKSMKIPKGASNGDLVSIKGEGLPKYRGKGNGDLYCRLQVHLPKSLGKEETTLLEKLRDLHRKQTSATYVRVGRFGLIKLKPKEDPRMVSEELLDLAEILSESGLTPAVDLSAFRRGVPSEVVSSLVKVHRKSIGKGVMSLVGPPEVEKVLESMMVEALFRVRDVLEPDEDETSASSGTSDAGEEHRHGKWAVRSLGGGILNSESLAEDGALEKIFDAGDNSFVAFDFSGILHIDSTVIGRLIRIYKQVSPRGRVALLGITPKVQDSLEETAVLGLFDVADNEEGLAS